MISSDGYYDDSLSLEDATLYLRERLWEFPFNDRQIVDPATPMIIDSRSQAVQVASMVSQFGAGLIPKNELRLGFIHNANTQRSGKSLLVKLAVIPTNGRMATQSWNVKDEELRKVLDAEVMRGSRYVVFDNVRGHVASPVLEAFMTAPVWTGRILGTPRMFEASNMATVFITGNDMTVSPDMAQRCLICDLFVQEANIQERVVTAPISDAWLMEWKNRHAILSALWTIIRHWTADGQPLATENLRPGYKRWCEVFGGIVKYAGFGDCLAMPSEVESEVNTEMSDMKALVKGLSGALFVTPPEKRLEYSFQDIVNAAHEGGYFDWILDGKEEPGTLPGERNYMLTNKANPKFGRLLNRYAPKSGARIFRLGPTETVRLNSTGKNRHKRFVFERA